MTPRSAGKKPSTIRQILEAPDSVGGRGRLFLTAIRLFGAQGYAATSVRDIVRAAGVTAPTLYHHFGSKEGLYLAIVREGRAYLEQAQRKALDAGGSAAERIRRLCCMHFDLRRESAQLAWAVERIMSDPLQVGLSDDFRALASDSVRQLEELVEEGVRSGEFRRCAPRHVALALFGSVAVASRPYLAEASPEQSKKELEGMLVVILAGIAPGGRSETRVALDAPSARRTRGPRQQVSVSRRRG